MPGTALLTWSWDVPRAQALVPGVSRLGDGRVRVIAGGARDIWSLPARRRACVRHLVDTVDTHDQPLQVKLDCHAQCQRHVERIVKRLEWLCVSTACLRVQRRCLDLSGAGGEEGNVSLTSRRLRNTCQTSRKPRLLSVCRIEAVICARLRNVSRTFGFTIISTWR